MAVVNLANLSKSMQGTKLSNTPAYKHEIASNGYFMGVDSMSEVQGGDGSGISDSTTYGSTASTSGNWTTASNGLSGVTGGIGSVTGGISNSINGVSGAVGSAVGSISSMASGIGTTLSNAESALGNSVGSIGSGLGKVADAVGLGGITDGIGSSTSGLSSALSSVTGGIGSGAGFIGSGISSISNGLSSGISAVETPLGNMFSEGESLLGKGESLVSGLAGKAVNGVSNAIGSMTKGLFGKSGVDKKAAKLNKKTADALKATTAKGSPRSTAFKLNGPYKQTDPINLKQVSGSDSSKLGPLSSIGNLGNRLGGMFGSAENSVMNGVKDVTHSSLVQGVEKGITTGFSAVSDIRSGINGVMDTFTSVPRNLASGITNDWQSIVGPISRAVSGIPNSLDDFYDSKLTATTDANGNPIDGVPSNMGIGQIASYYNMAKNLGCEIAHPSVFANSIMQSVRGSLLGLASTFNMDNLLKSLTTCPEFGFAFQNYGGSLFKGLLGHNVKSAEIIGSQLPSNSNVLYPSLAKEAVTNSNIKTNSDVQSVWNTFNHFNVPTNSPYTDSSGTGNNGTGNISRYARTKLNSMITSRPDIIVDDVVGDVKSGPTDQELLQANAMGGAVKTLDGLVSYASLESNQQIIQGVSPVKQTTADATKLSWMDISDIADTHFLDNDTTINTVQSSTTEFLNTNTKNMPALYTELSTDPSFSDVVKAFYHGGGILTSQGFVHYSIVNPQWSDPINSLSDEQNALSDKLVLGWAGSNNRSGQYVIDMPIVQQSEDSLGNATSILVYNDSVVTNSYKPLVTKMTGDPNLAYTYGGAVAAY